METHQGRSHEEIRDGERVEFDSANFGDAERDVGDHRHGRHVEQLHDLAEDALLVHHHVRETAADLRKHLQTGQAGKHSSTSEYAGRGRDKPKWIHNRP